MVGNFCYTTLVNIIAAVGIAVIVWYGGGQVIRNAVTPGTLVVGAAHPHSLAG